jgi:hypothetical protein
VYSGSVSEAIEVENWVEEVFMTFYVEEWLIALIQVLFVAAGSSLRVSVFSYETRRVMAAIIITQGLIHSQA